MTDSPFNDFVSTLDFGEISGPTRVEEAHDALEQRDLTIRLTSLLNAGVLRGLDGSTAAERSAWRSGADLALGTLSAQYEPAYQMTRLQLYALLVKAICAAYRQVDVSVVNAAASAVLSLYAREVDAGLAGAWRNNAMPIMLAQETLVRLVMQAGYVYSDLHPAAVLH
jgi:hypothetical protein